MGKPRGTHYVVTASFTKTGAPIYFTPEGTWTSDLQKAALIETVAERDAQVLLASAHEAVACDVYTFMVSRENGVIDPLSAREEIRAKGPTIEMRRPDTGFSSKGV
ncbi:MAG: DUF2849 domain-containing protein [Polyangiaceae bacterium]|nr:DUF2849 domain-containing protein [Polyangiaceae bacterium]